MFIRTLFMTYERIPFIKWSISLYGHTTFDRKVFSRHVTGSFPVTADAECSGDFIRYITTQRLILILRGISHTCLKSLMTVQCIYSYLTFHMYLSTLAKYLKISV